MEKINQTNLIIAQLKATGSKSISDILHELIEVHDIKPMLEGQRYYLNNNDIRRRNKHYWDNGIKKIDRTKINNKMSNSWHRLLVDQKTGYLLGKKPTISSENENYSKILNIYLDDEFNKTLQDLLKNASNKGVEYLYVYIDDKGEFKNAIIPSEQIIPIYDYKFNKDLEEVIRYYSVIVNGKEKTQVEWYTKDLITIYLEDENGEFKKTEEQNYYYINEQGYNWGVVPFIEFKNNQEKTGDLKLYKDLIDVYDKVNSDIVNDIEELQNLIYVLKGYESESLREFTENLRYYKAISVAEDGDVGNLSNEIPGETINKLLDRLEDNIIMFGQAVNPKFDNMGNAPSGIALKFMYNLLDIKAEISAIEFKKGIKNYLSFLNTFLNLNKLNVLNEENRKVDIIFNKTILVNENELVAMAQQSKGIISDYTIIANHPWTKNVEEEQERLREQGEYVNLDTQEFEYKDETEEGKGTE